MLKMGVPVATPVGWREVLLAILALAKRSVYPAAFEKDVQLFLNIPFSRATNSGRAALFFALEALRRNSARDEVIIPAFTCPSVGRAVVKATLKPILCDVGPGGSGFDVKALEQSLTDRTLAVIVDHLYGYPVDIEPLIAICQTVGAVVIEDAAQAFGAKLNGQYVGTIADVGVFSFGMSKVLWSGGGGMVVSSDPRLACGITEVMERSPVPGRLRETCNVAAFAIISALIRTHHLGPVSAFWTKAVRGKHDTDDFEAFRGTPSQAMVAASLLKRLTEITSIRKRNATYLAAMLAGFKELTAATVPARSEPVYLRFPLIIDDLSIKHALIRALASRGISVSQMYSRESYEQLCHLRARPTSCPRTEYLVDRLLNLPTHGYLRACDLSAMAQAFETVLGQRRVVHTVASVPLT